MNDMTSYNKAFLIAAVILAQADADDTAQGAERVYAVLGILGFTSAEERKLMDAVAELCHPGISHLELTTILKVGIDKLLARRVDIYGSATEVLMIPNNG